MRQTFRSDVNLDGFIDSGDATSVAGPYPTPHSVKRRTCAIVTADSLGAARRSSARSATISIRGDSRFVKVAGGDAGPRLQEENVAVGCA